MSTSLQLTSNSPEYEIVLSINLQIPISIKPEVTMLPPIYSHDNNQTILSENSNNLVQYIQLQPANLRNLPENFSVREILAEIVVPNFETQNIQSQNITLQIGNSKNQESIRDNEKQHQLLKRKTIIGRVVDTFNDGLAFAVNVTGSVAFLGKLANYSWE